MELPFCQGEVGLHASLKERTAVCIIQKDREVVLISSRKIEKFKSVDRKY